MSAEALAPGAAAAVGFVERGVGDGGFGGHAMARALACLGQWLEDVRDAKVWSSSDVLSASGVVPYATSVLCSRRFTHLSRSQTAPYVSELSRRLAADVAAHRPLRFCLDLGPGYHASTRSDFTGLRFSPGLGELLALRQIRLFSDAVVQAYPPGVHFDLVIDDVCAWMTNDVPLDQTRDYVRQLSALTGAVGLAEQVAVLAESAVLDVEVYRRWFDQEDSPEPSRPLDVSEVDNVSRFVGVACSAEKALEHWARYQRAQAVSERMMQTHLEGVRLTQRATERTLGFRCFPGADARLQAGEVDVLVDGEGAVRPVLITSRNSMRYHRIAVGAEHLLRCWPEGLGAVFVSVPLPQHAGDPVAQ